MRDWDQTFHLKKKNRRGKEKFNFSKTSRVREEQEHNTMFCLEEEVETEGEGKKKTYEA